MCIVCFLCPPLELAKAKKSFTDGNLVKEKCAIEMAKECAIEILKMLNSQEISFSAAF